MKKFLERIILIGPAHDATTKRAQFLNKRTFFSKCYENSSMKINCFCEVLRSDQYSVSWRISFFKMFEFISKKIIPLEIVFQTAWSRNVTQTMLRRSLPSVERNFLLPNSCRSRRQEHKNPSDLTSQTVQGVANRQQDSEEHWTIDRTCVCPASLLSDRSCTIQAEKT